jgi:hypothetical protein
MQRTVATLPDSVAELCLIRLGFQVRRLSALPFAVRLGRAIDRAAAEAMKADAGLFGSERFGIAWNHFGVLQYWRSFDELEAWSHRAPHSEWWRAAVERGRTRKDLGIYHEVFLVPRQQVESIYLDCRPAGLAAFGTTGEAVGPMTASRDRLGRRPALP